MDFKTLEAVLWIDRLGSFRAAAEALHMTQPAVSVRISQLETALDARVFYREPKSVTLTPVGMTLVHYAKQILELRDELVETIKGHQEASGIIRIAAIETIAQTWISDLLMEIRHKYPNLTVDLEIAISDEISRKITKGMVDVGFFLGPVNSPKMIESELCRYETALVGEGSLSFQNADKLDLGQVPSISIVTMSRNTIPHSAIRNFLAREGIVHHRVDTMSSIPSILTITLRGEGLALLPYAVMREYLASGKLRVFETGMKLPVLRCVAGRLINHGSPVIEDIVSIAERVSASIT
ncbi:LysR family transcriptional regulator [Acetobacter sp. TBRC 12305]|uniref:LysR family transcriptional regulator n=1 Tax=Acetobacter garciniae TaxID=2817435 RepID=A0A939HP26_9PROT|nr:LysR family transcriptional regulator [Acetobacter garciniae]MBX0345419.1 LysR family transcriptional regulator [Acetobacter garciniae]